jgi:hypothetical protein
MIIDVQLVNKVAGRNGREARATRNAASMEKKRAVREANMRNTLVAI